MGLFDAGVRLDEVVDRGYDSTIVDTQKRIVKAGRDDSGTENKKSQVCKGNS